MIKSRDSTLLTKVHIVKAMVFPFVMYGCENWIIKKAENQRVDAFGLWFWRTLLRVSWTARRSSQSVLKEISPEYSLEAWCWGWSSNNVATWWEELIHWKRPCCWEKLKAGRKGYDRMRQLDGITDSIGMNLSEVWEMEKDREAWHVVHVVSKSGTWLSDCTTRE